MENTNKEFDFVFKINESNKRKVENISLNKTKKTNLEILKRELEIKKYLKSVAESIEDIDTSYYEDLTNIAARRTR